MNRKTLIAAMIVFAGALAGPAGLEARIVTIAFWGGGAWGHVQMVIGAPPAGVPILDPVHSAINGAPIVALTSSGVATEDLLPGQTASPLGEGLLFATADGAIYYLDIKGATHTLTQITDFAGHFTDGPPVPVEIGAPEAPTLTMLLLGFALLAAKARQARPARAPA